LKSKEASAFNFDFMNIPTDTIECVSCKEGYSANKTHVLGVYLFSAYVNIPEETDWLENGY
jgi:hypothetical protein